MVDSEAGPGAFWRGVASVFVVCTALGVLMGLHFAFDATAHGRPAPVARRLIEETTGFWAAGLLFFPLRWVALRWRLDRPGWARSLPAHLLALPAIASTHTLLMWGSRSLAYPALGLGRYDYGSVPWRFLMELPTQALGYAVTTGGVYLFARAREARERELRAAQLAAGLKQARLENLELRLRPHFLFNALNTIAATMYDDPHAADEQIGRLSELLRASLRPGGEHEVPLGDELEILEHYLALVRARFSDDLAITVDASTEARGVKVPQLLLQPLVENAVRHGRASRDGRGAISIRARLDDGILELVVADDGPGLGEELAPGLGLSLTAERLELLYGARAELRAGRRDGGFEVVIRLPARRESELAEE